MSSTKSKQTRILRRRLTLHTVLTWVIYSILFAVCALMLNGYVVPQIAEFVASRTAPMIYYDPTYYLERFGIDNLLNWYLNDLDDQGISYEFTPFGSIETATLQTQDIDETDKSGSEVQTENEEIPHNQTETEEIKAIDEYEEPVGIVNFVTFNDLGETVPQGDEVITPYFLAQQAIEHDFAAVSTEGGNWQVLHFPSERSDGMGPFQARDLSLYNTIKQFKIPVAIAIYLIGCLIIIMVEMRRAMGYFDQLSGAVAGLIADRNEPVRLPNELSLAQDELNNIRLEALNDERVAHSAEQRKNELVAYLAHDIRTPLTSIIGYLSMLDESPDLPEKQRRQFTHTAFAKAEGLESLINEFFEITRYNLQSIPLERSWTNANIMLQQLADEFLPQAQERTVSIRVNAPEDAMLFIDASKLARALENVLRNAIAYADESTEVTIAAARSGEACTTEDTPDDSSNTDAPSTDTSEGGWTITITDMGREISEVHLESIFEKFYREDAARSSDGGAGLGLAIAKEIVVAHGGTISAASENGTTAFTIFIPEPEK